RQRGPRGHLVLRVRGLDAAAAGVGRRRPDQNEGEQGRQRPADPRCPAADPRFCFLLAAITLVSQGAAVAIQRTEDERLRKWFTAGGVAFDLGALAVFKYYGFFVSDVSDALDSIGLGMPLPLVTIALPVGVSFFSFQAVTYVV